MRCLEAYENELQGIVRFLYLVNIRATGTLKTREGRVHQMASLFTIFRISMRRLLRNRSSWLSLTWSWMDQFFVVSASYHYIMCGSSPATLRPLRAGKRTAFSPSFAEARCPRYDIELILGTWFLYVPPKWCPCELTQRLFFVYLVGDVYRSSARIIKGFWPTSRRCWDRTLYSGCGHNPCWAMACGSKSSEARTICPSRWTPMHQCPLTCHWIDTASHQCGRMMPKWHWLRRGHGRSSG